MDGLTRIGVSIRDVNNTVIAVVVAEQLLAASKQEFMQLNESICYLVAAVIFFPLGFELLLFFPSLFWRADAAGGE